MVELGKDGEISNVFGGAEIGGNENTSYFENGVNIEGETNAWGENVGTFRPVSADKAMTKKGFWSKVKEFLFQEIDLNAPIKVELTPYQQKIENEINEFLHQEISFKGFVDIIKK